MNRYRMQHWLMVASRPRKRSIRPTSVAAPCTRDQCRGRRKRAAGKDPYAPCKGDSDAVAAWRSRMGTEAAKLIYRLRGQTAEWVNAQARNRGLWFMPRARPTPLSHHRIAVCNNS